MGSVELVGKATAIWIGIALLAVLNGGFREALLIPRLGEKVGHVLSTLLLSAVIVCVAFASGGWMQTTTLEAAWAVSAGWLIATLLFEIIAGHYLFGNSWEKIFADYCVSNGRVWMLIPATILFAAPLAHVGLDPKWLVAYLISNTIAAAMLLAAVADARFARWSFALLFAYAGVYNNWLGFTKPLEYQGFADMALVPWYREFIAGPLGEIWWIIPAIGVGQLLVAGAWAMGNQWLRWAAIGGCTFLLAIAPLGIGSALPFSFIVSLAMVIVASHLRDS